jgi:DNA-directed RNA polymerase specialized sigma24 family protein
MRAMVSALLDQHTYVETAERVGCAERTVRRVVERLRTRLRARGYG